MRGLSALVRAGVPAGEPLPDVFKTLARAQIHFRRGEVALIAGPTGSMKTMFVLALAHDMGLPTLYFSNDSNEMTVVSRMVARVTGMVNDPRLERRILDDPEWAGNQLKSVDHIRWSFDESPTLDDIVEEAEAFEELYGRYPAVIVVDILTKVDYSEDSQYQSDNRIVRELDSVARQTGAAVIAVGHTSETEKNQPHPGSQCQPRSAILQQIARLPTVVLTVAYQYGTFFLSPVKNRHAFSDASGLTQFRLAVDAPTATMSDLA
jgi:replicative DNA helicase